MSNQEAKTNDFGETELREISEELRNILKSKGLAIWNWGKECLVSNPKTTKDIKDVRRLFKKHSVRYQANKNFDWLNDSPKELIEKARLQREIMSRAENYAGDLPKRMAASEFQLAGALYAFHARRCLITDLDSRDRRAEALIALENLNEYPVLLVCREMNRTRWIEEIQRRIKDVEIYDFKENTGPLPEGKGKYIFLLTYANSEKKARLLQRREGRLKKHPYFTVIVDHADYLRNAKKTKFNALWRLCEGNMQRCRLVLTDRPMSSSKKDLEAPLKLLGLWDDLDKELQGVIDGSSRDPVDEQRSSFFEIDQDRLARKLYHELRATCMVRRAEDYGLQVREEKRFTKCSSILPKKVLGERRKQKNTAEMSNAHWTGLCKAADIVKQIKAYRLEHPGEMLLIIAHHNAVIEYLKAELNIPAIYGKVQSEEKRKELRRRFREAKAGAALILAQDILLPELGNETDKEGTEKLDAGFGNIDTIFFAEMRNTTAVQDRLEVHLLKGHPERHLNVFHLVHYRDSNIDPDSTYRESQREKDTGEILDGR